MAYVLAEHQLPVLQLNMKLQDQTPACVFHFLKAMKPVLPEHHTFPQPFTYYLYTQDSIQLHAVFKR